MGRGDQPARQWRIIQTLISSKHGKTLADLVKEENCHRRTIYRDLEALQEPGFPIYQQHRDGGAVSSALGQAGSREVGGTLLTLFVSSGMYDGGVHSRAASRRSPGPLSRRSRPLGESIETKDT